MSAAATRSRARCLVPLSNSPAERLHVGMKVRHDLHLSLCFVLAKFSSIGLPLACKLGTDKGSLLLCTTLLMHLAS